MALAIQAQIISLIQNYWSEADKFHEQEILSCNVDFLLRFFKEFIAEIEEHLSCININGNPTDEPENVSADDEVSLFKKVVNIFEKLGCTMNLINMYTPNPKKMFPFVHICMHFLVFVDKFLDNKSTGINRILQMLNDAGYFKELKQQHLQTRAEKSELLGSIRSEAESLRRQNEEVDKAYKKFLANKAAMDKDEDEEMVQVRKLENEVVNLEYKVKSLEEGEADIKQSIITNEDFENLKRTHHFLELERDNVGDPNMEPELGENQEICLFEQLVRTLLTLTYAPLKVDELLASRKGIDGAQTIKENNVKKLEKSIATAQNRQVKYLELQETLKKLKKTLKQREVEFAFNSETLEKLYNNENEKFKLDLEEFKQREISTQEMKKDIKRLEDNKRKLEVGVQQEFEKMVKNHKEVLNKFTMILIHINRISHRSG